MAISAILAFANHQAASAQASPGTSHRRHGGHQAASLTDIDAQGSSVASPPSSTGKIASKTGGKIGSKIDVSA